MKILNCFVLEGKSGLLQVVAICQLCCWSRTTYWSCLCYCIGLRFTLFTRNTLGNGARCKRHIVTYRSCLSSAKSCCSLISTISSGKSSAQSILDRYEQTRPNPSFPLQIYCRWLTEFRQSSPNIASNRLLNVSWAVSP